MILKGGILKVDKVEVKINVINQLKLLRQSTFKDKLSFLDEDIQNAQRAKSKRVDIRTDTTNKILTIENDGQILKNPQSLFSIAESEWDDDVVASENPFGTGFFSNITVSDYIEIYTGNKHIIFNIGNMINTGNTDIQVVETEESYNGFKLILNNFDYSSISMYYISERVKMLGNYVHDLDIYYNNNLQPKKNLTEGDSSVFIRKIEDDDSFTGWIALNTNYSQDVKVFYKGRFVTKLESLYYVKGDLHITDKALNLTSPDRKDIIRDSKYIQFINTVKSHIQELANQSFLTGEQKSIEQHIDSISNYADKRKLKDLMTFLIFNTEDEEDAKYLNGIALAKRDNEDVTTLNDYEVFVTSKASNQVESNFHEISIQSEVTEKSPEASGTTYHSGGSGSTTRPEIDKKKTKERKGESIKFEEEPVFWLGFDEVAEQEGKFKIAQHYRLKVIVSRNKFESSVLDLLGYEQNVVHISKLTENTKITATVSNTELSPAEQRALMLLDMISRIVGFSRNVFAVGDVLVVKETTVDVLNKRIEKVEYDYTAIYDHENNKIYVDRATIDKTKLRTDLIEHLDLDDYKFIMLNLRDIVRSFGLIKFENEKPKDLYDCIINTLAVA